RDRLIALARTHPQWALGFEDEHWAEWNRQHTRGSREPDESDSWQWGHGLPAAVLHGDGTLRLPPWQGYATLRAEHGGGPKRLGDGAGLGDAGGAQSPGGPRSARGPGSSAAAARAPHAAGRAALRRGPRKALRERRPDRAGTPPNTGVTGASTQRT